MPDQPSPQPRKSPDERKNRLAELVTDLRKALRRGPVFCLDLVRATCELGLASLRLRLTDPARLGLLEIGSGEAEAALSPAQRNLLDRVAHAVPAMGLRVPWRSDCLVQALAAQRWLTAAGMAARIRLGARRDEQGAFAAHAWLTVGERIVTGGDGPAYAEFERSGLKHEQQRPRQAENKHE